MSGQAPLAVKPAAARAEIATGGPHAATLARAPKVQALQTKSRALNARAGDGKGVVQRAVGYEAEVGALRVEQRQGYPSANLAKGSVLWRGSGWDVSVDEQGGGFDVEFRTVPINDLASGGRQRAASLLGTLAGEWAKMPRGRASASVPASQINGAAPNNVEIYSAGHQAAQVQASAGLSMAALHAVHTGQALHQFTANQVGHPDRVNRLAAVARGGQADPPVLQQVNAHLAQIRTALGLPAHENIDQLGTVIGMIVTIPYAAHQKALEYPKGAAGGLLARTNFTTILKQLPPNQLRAIKTNARGWRNVLMRITRQLVAHRVTARTPVFPSDAYGGHGIPRSDRLARGLKIGSWYEGLAQDRDEATEAGYTAEHGDTQTGALLESLGSYGDRMDADSYSVSITGATEVVGGLAAVVVGYVAGLTTGLGATLGVAGGAAAAHGASTIVSTSKSRPIFEFRALGLTQQDGLVNSGLALWDYVDVAHGRGPVGANQISRFKRGWNWLAGGG